MPEDVSTTISHDLIGHVRQLYYMTLEDFAAGKFLLRGLNGYSAHAFPAYIVSVAAVEAFFNEVFLSDIGRLITRDRPLWKLPKDWIEKLELSNKLILVPELLFNNSFTRDSQPYQDMVLLIKVRNLIIHYKMTGKAPNLLKTLDQHGISLVAPTLPLVNFDTDYPWARKLQSAEGIRWAHNTACKTVMGLVAFVPQEQRKGLLVDLAKNFQPIMKDKVIKWLKEHGVRLNGDSGEE